MTRMSRHPSDAALTQAAGGDWLNLAACRSQRDRFGDLPTSDYYRP